LVMDSDLIAASNKLYMVTDDDATSERGKTRVTSPQAGVFVGDKRIDPNF